MSLPEFARLVGTTPPTARRLLDSGAVPFSAVTRGTRVYRTVARTDAERYVATHGLFKPRRAGQSQYRAEDGGGQVASLGGVVAEVRELRESLTRLQQSLSRAQPPDPAPDRLASVVALEEALRLQRLVTTLQAEADEGRAKTVRLLLEALAVSENTDEKRREAARVSDQIVASLTTPGHPGQI